MMSSTPLKWRVALRVAPKDVLRDALRDAPKDVLRDVLRDAPRAALRKSMKWLSEAKSRAYRPRLFPKSQGSLLMK